MGKTQVNEKDRSDLERLEQIVKDAGHAGIGTAELSKKSGTNPARVRSLLNDHFSRSHEGDGLQVEGQASTRPMGFINQQRMTSQPRIERSESWHRKVSRRVYKIDEHTVSRERPCIAPWRLPCPLTTPSGVMSRDRL
jgi:hypothetical protein